MRAGAILAALLAVAPAMGVALLTVDATPSVDAPQYVAHAPITITGDGDFAVAGQPNVAAGVVSGTGTAGDPYVISGWDILPVDRGACGVRLRGTSAHVVVEANRIRDPFGDVPQLVALPTGLAAGVCVEDARNVRVAGNVISSPNGDGVRVRDSHHVTVEGNTLEGPGAAGVRVSGDAWGVAVRDNHVRGFFIGLDHGAGDLTVTGNRFEANGWAGVRLHTSARHELRDNVIRENLVGVRALYSRLVMVENRVEDNLYEGVLGLGVNATLQGNTIAGNGDGVRLAAVLGRASVANATDNWWGAEDGPSGAGNGTGDSLVVDPWSAADHAPWLEEAPAAGDDAAVGGDGGGDLAGTDTMSGASDADVGSDATSVDPRDCVELGLCSTA